MFEWLTEVIRALLQFLPRYVHIASTQAGVLFKRDKARKLCPGIHWYWPFWSDIQTEETNRRSTGIAAQNLVTRDRIKVTVSIGVGWRISSIMRALVYTEDHEATLVEVSQGCVKRIVMGHTFDELSEHDRIDEELSEMIGERMKRFGIVIDEAYFTDLCDAFIVSTVST